MNKTTLSKPGKLQESNDLVRGFVLHEQCNHQISASLGVGCSRSCFDLDLLRFEVGLTEIHFFFLCGGDVRRVEVSCVRRAESTLFFDGAR